MNDAVPDAPSRARLRHRRTGPRTRSARTVAATATALFLLPLTACGTAGDRSGGAGAGPKSGTAASPAPSGPAARRDGTDAWWRVPAVVHLASAAESTTYNGRYTAEYIWTQTEGPARDVTKAYDLTSLKGRLELGSLGEGTDCTRQEYVFTCLSRSQWDSGSGNAPPSTR